MGTSDRRHRHRTSLRREILAAASQLFVEQGFQRVTMRRIAERIEYSPTTIYLHFKDKNELLEAVCQETFAQLAGKLERLSLTASTPLGHLREALRTYVEFGLANRHQYAVAFSGSHPGSGGGSFEKSIGSGVFDVLRQAVRACAERGDIQAQQVDVTAQALWAAAHGVTSLLITMPAFPFVPVPALVDHLVDTLLAGLKAPAPAAARRAPGPPRRTKWEFFD